MLVTGMSEDLEPPVRTGKTMGTRGDGSKHSLKTEQPSTVSETIHMQTTNELRKATVRHHECLRRNKLEPQQMLSLVVKGWGDTPPHSSPF